MWPDNDSQLLRGMQWIVRETAGVSKSKQEMGGPGMQPCINIHQDLLSWQNISTTPTSQNPQHPKVIEDFRFPKEIPT